MGGGGDWPGDQWAANVTNVVKPAQFTSPHKDPCYKRRQSKPKNRHYQRKSPQIDDVCNNMHQSTPKNSTRETPVTPTGSRGTGPRCRRAVAGPGRATHSDLASLVWRAPEGPEGTGGLRGAAPNEVRPPSLAGGRALRRPKHQRGNKHQHAARTASGRAAAHRHSKRPGPQVRQA